MARKRNTGNTATQEAPEGITEVPSSNYTTRSNKVMAGLSAEQIQALLGKTRTKGQYVVYLNQFIDSGEGGLCVNEQWVDLATKKATTLKQGFEGAKDNKEAKEGSDLIKVIASDDKVYLINLAAAGVEVEADAA